MWYNNCFVYVYICPRSAVQMNKDEPSFFFAPTPITKTSFHVYCLFARSRLKCVAKNFPCVRLDLFSHSRQAQYFYLYFGFSHSSRWANMNIMWDRFWRPLPNIRHVLWNHRWIYVYQYQYIYTMRDACMGQIHIAFSTIFRCRLHISTSDIGRPCEKLCWNLIS